MESDLADHYPVRVVVTAERSHPAQDVGPDDAVFVACPEDATVVDADEAVGVGIVVF
jgi:hypothetical protein